MEEPAEDVLRFITSRIDTVPELEALLLFWEHRPTALTVKQLASMLYVPRGIGAVRGRFLFWSGLCFVGLTLSNALLVIDLVFVPEINLYVWRLASAAAAMLVLLFGLVWESDR